MTYALRPEIRHFSFPIPPGPIPEELETSYWAEMTTGLDADGVRSFLRWRWPVPEDKEVALLREKFLSYVPSGISSYDGHSWLTLDHPEPAEEDEEGIGDCYYLGEPVPLEQIASEVRAKFRTAETQPLTSLIEFFSLFAGLRECLDICGNFNPPSDWETLESIMGGIVEMEPLQPWCDAFAIYGASNGDMVLLGASGEVAWYCLSCAEIVPIAENFSGFVRYFRLYLDERWPLDSFGKS